MLTVASGRKVRLGALPMAMPPKSAAENPARALWSPIGVRAPATITEVGMADSPF
jgi:hypothetical protein